MPTWNPEIFCAYSSQYISLNGNIFCFTKDSGKWKLNVTASLFTILQEGWNWQSLDMNSKTENVLLLELRKGISC